MQDYDIIVVGGGPAGLTAALYACRAGKTVLVIEKAAFGGQITYSPKVENIPGFTSVTGNEFADRLVEQVLSQGAEMEPDEVVAVETDGERKTVVTTDGRFTARAVILATGARHRQLGLPNEEALIGEGISFCAVCDGAFYAGKTVGVVGGGNSALQEAILLADVAETVHVFQNLDTLTGEQRLIDALTALPNVQVHTGVTVSEYHGSHTLGGVTLTHAADGATETVSLDGLFLAVGLLPQNEPFASLVPLNPQGYIAAAEDCLTGTPGVFAAGDCRTKRIRQVTTAAADGAVAALAACEYLDHGI